MTTNRSDLEAALRAALGMDDAEQAPPADDGVETFTVPSSSSGPAIGLNDPRLESMALGGVTGSIAGPTLGGRPDVGPVAARAFADHFTPSEPGPRMLSPEATGAALDAIMGGAATATQKAELTEALRRAATYPSAPQNGGPLQIL